MALLALGTLFSAVRLPGELVLAAGRCRPELVQVDDFLDEALDGGPVICDPVGPRYYALVPVGVPIAWHAAAEEWRALDVACLGGGTYLGVPRVDAVRFDQQTHTSYWSVPLSPEFALCTPLAVARIIAAGQASVAKALEDEGSGIP
ncbi:hypothetical protein [Streptomyces sp. S3(2020)]|uniref:hypothetical protein n=1 Tax=Streptomyces sp. S3(2020) TaxID=2732044 RepID=UPI001F111369|nr:hypothetical protein [Streptomyces sp. S3(2020)]